MDSLKELFKIGNGPSSSHTMGPERAAKQFKAKNPNAVSFKAELYGSLALTGIGHLTDWVIIETLKPAVTEIVWLPEVEYDYHPNGMKLFALDKDGNTTDEWLVFSVGGGSLMNENQARQGGSTVYPLGKMDDIMKWCVDNNKELWQFVEEHEEADIWTFLKEIKTAMNDAVKVGIAKEGVLPGTLKYPRKAKSFYERYLAEKNIVLKSKARIFAYTLAVSEENGGGGRVVTAPTCGAAGVIPGLIAAMAEDLNLDETTQLRGLAIAGLLGNLIKENASISGAEAGCQAEVGAACSMAAGMATYFLGGTMKQIEYAAEMALEHHLGLTCDPVGGYVQIPCIERNAAAAVRALDSADYSLFTDGNHTVSFDQVVITMAQTGKDLKCEYRETSLGGLAKFNFDAEC